MKSVSVCVFWSVVKFTYLMLIPVHFPRFDTVNLPQCFEMFIEKVDRSSIDKVLSH